MADGSYHEQAEVGGALAAQRSIACGELRGELRGERATYTDPVFHCQMLANGLLRCPLRASGFHCGFSDDPKRCS